MRQLIAILLLGLTPSYADAGGRRVFASSGCTTCVNPFQSRAVVSHSYVAPVAKVFKQPYIAYSPVQYAVAPWVQQQAQDTYHFRGSEERLELERLRGYVAAIQEINVSNGLTVEEPGEEPLEGFEGQAPPTAQAPATWNAPPKAASPPPNATPELPPNRALVQMYCAKCHGGAEPAGAFELSANTILTDETVGAVVRVLAADSMPLGPDKQTPAPLDAQTKFNLMMELGTIGLNEGSAVPENAVPTEGI